MVAIESIKEIFAELVERKEAPMKYMKYTNSVKTAWNCVLWRNSVFRGFNNNPTAQQFTAAYKITPHCLGCKVATGSNFA